jgi:hypothetical protein
MRCAILVACGILACLATSSAPAETITFERNVVGRPPSDFDSWGTGERGPGFWAVLSDASARGGNDFEQFRDEPTQQRVATSIYKPSSGADLELALRFKAMSGTLQQSVGIAVRLASPDDYYVACASALMQAVRLFRVVKGKWGELASTHAQVARSGTGSF